MADSFGVFNDFTTLDADKTTVYFGEGPKDTDALLTRDIKKTSLRGTDSIQYIIKKDGIKQCGSYWCLICKDSSSNIGWDTLVFTTDWQSFTYWKRDATKTSFSINNVCFYTYSSVDYFVMATESYEGDHVCSITISDGTLYRNRYLITKAANTVIMASTTCLIGFKYDGTPYTILEIDSFDPTANYNAGGTGRIFNEGGLDQYFVHSMIYDQSADKILALTTGKAKDIEAILPNATTDLWADAARDYTWIDDADPLDVADAELGTTPSRIDVTTPPEAYKSGPYCFGDSSNDDLIVGFENPAGGAKQVYKIVVYNLGRISAGAATTQPKLTVSFLGTSYETQQNCAWVKAGAPAWDALTFYPSTYITGTDLAGLKMKITTQGGGSDRYDYLWTYATIVAVYYANTDGNGINHYIWSIDKDTADMSEANWTKEDTLTTVDGLITTSITCAKFIGNYKYGFFWAFGYVNGGGTYATIRGYEQSYDETVTTITESTFFGEKAWETDTFQFWVEDITDVWRPDFYLYDAQMVGGSIHILGSDNEEDMAFYITSGGMKLWQKFIDTAMNYAAVAFSFYYLCGNLTLWTATSIDSIYQISPSTAQYVVTEQSFPWTEGFITYYHETGAVPYSAGVIAGFHNGLPLFAATAYNRVYNNDVANYEYTLNYCYETLTKKLYSVTDIACKPVTEIIANMLASLTHLLIKYDTVYLSNDIVTASELNLLISNYPMSILLQQLSIIQDSDAASGGTSTGWIDLFGCYRLASFTGYNRSSEFNFDENDLATYETGLVGINLVDLVGTDAYCSNFVLRGANHTSSAQTNTGTTLSIEKSIKIGYLNDQNAVDDTATLLDLCLAYLPYMLEIEYLTDSVYIVGEKVLCSITYQGYDDEVTFIVLSIKSNSDGREVVTIGAPIYNLLAFEQQLDERVKRLEG